MYINIVYVILAIVLIISVASLIITARGIYLVNQIEKELALLKKMVGGYKTDKKDWKCLFCGMLVSNKEKECPYCIISGYRI